MREQMREQYLAQVCLISWTQIVFPLLCNKPSLSLSLIEPYITHKRALHQPSKSPVLSPKRELLTLLLRAVTRRARDRAHGLAPPPRVGGEGEGSNAADTVRNTSEVMGDEPAAKSKVERERTHAQTCAFA